MKKKNGTNSNKNIMEIKTLRKLELIYNKQKGII